LIHKVDIFLIEKVYIFLIIITSRVDLASPTVRMNAEITETIKAAQVYFSRLPCQL